MIIINQISKPDCPPCVMLKSKFSTITDKVKYSYINISQQMYNEDSELVNTVLRKGFRSLPIIVITNDDNDILFIESTADINYILEVYNKLVEEDLINGGI